MPAVGQHHVGPEPVEHLPGQVEEPRALERAGGVSARLEAVGIDRDADAVDLQVDHLRSRPAERGIEPPGRAVELEGLQQLVHRGLALIVEDAAGQRRGNPSRGRPVARAARGSPDAAPLDGSR